AGIRRITALTGKAALDYVRQEEEILADVAATFRVPPGQVGQRVTALLEEIKTLKKQASQRPREAGAGVSAEDLLGEAQEIGGSAPGLPPPRRGPPPGEPPAPPLPPAPP